VAPRSPVEGLSGSATRTSPSAAAVRAREVFDAVDVDPHAAEPLAEQLLVAARSDHDAEAEGWALRALAWAARARWDHAAAEAMLARALRIARRADHTDLAVQVLLARQAVRQETGRSAAARRDLAAALATTQTADGLARDERARLEVQVRMQLAITDGNAGHLDRAEAGFRAALRWRSELTETDLYKLLNNLGFVVALRGRHRAAVPLLVEAVEVADRLGPAASAPVLKTLGWTLVQSGRLAEGLQEFARAEHAYRDADIPTGEYHAEFADTMADLRLVPEATSAADRAVEECHRAGVPLMEAEAILLAAQVRLLAGDRAGAVDRAHRAATAFTRQRRPGWRDRALVVAAAALDPDGPVEVDEATAVRRAARRLERAGDAPNAVHAHLVAGQLAARAGTGAAARAELAAALRLSRRAALLTRVRGRLAGALAGVQEDDPRAVLVHCRAGLRDLAAHRAALPTTQLRALASGHGSELGELGLQVTLRHYGAGPVLAWMERTRAAALTDALPVHGSIDLAGLRSALEGRVLVEYACCAGRLVAIRLADSARVVELGPVRPVVEQLRALMFALRRLADPRSTAATHAARSTAEARLSALRELLVAPLGLDEAAELVVVPDGPLHGVPWSAVLDRAVAVAPSAAAWLHTARAPQRDGVLLVAGPDLHGADQEVAALRALHPQASVLGPAECTAAAVARAAGGADLVHLACHGTARADNPSFSAIELADGPLTVQQLHQAEIAPRRVVLASCHSGAEVPYAGGETLGFITALLALGSGGVVASIAAVPDVDAVDLMTRLHARLSLGETMARALFTARSQLDRTSAGGFVNWCVFTAHGAA
jgi:tetratricopeptide (TPR) repeat protein